jgi:tetratricopeptide (TPR) repeat protein
VTEKTVLLGQALAALRRKDFSAAYTVYEALLHERPDDPDVLFDYGRAKYAEYIDLDGAAELFERARTAQPESVETLLWLGDLCSLGYGRGYDAAAELYRKAIQLEPRAVDAYIGLGLLHRTPGSRVALADAITAFGAAVDVDDRRPDAHLNLGVALIEAGRSDEASAELVAAHRLLVAEGQQRQATGIMGLINRLQRGEPVKSFAYTNQSPRYRWLDSSRVV